MEKRLETLIIAAILVGLTAFLTSYLQDILPEYLPNQSRYVVAGIAAAFAFFVIMYFLGKKRREY